MIIDPETFTELTVHLKLATDAIVKVAGHLAALSNDDVRSEERSGRAIGEVMAMAIELVAMEKILRAVMEANREELATAASGVPDQKTEPLRS